MRFWLIVVMLGLSAPLILADRKEGDDTPGKDKPQLAAESIESLLERVEAAHKDHKDFSGDFDQSRFLPLLGDTIRSSGRFVFKKPDRIRWEYRRPHRSILVVTGEKAQRWSESTRRVERFNMGEDRGLDAVVKQMFVWFRGEFSKLGDDYTIEVTSRDPIRLKLTPKNEVMRQHIARIELDLDENLQLKSIRLVEPNQPGDEEPGHTLYAFTNTKLDQEVKDDQFEIKE